MGDQDEDDQLTKKEDLNASRKGDALDETQRKQVVLMKLKKWKDATIETKKITYSELKCNEQLWVVDAMNNIGLQWIE